MTIDDAEHMQADERLRASEQRLSIAKAAAGLGIHDYDVTTGLIDWDERVRELWGAQPGEAITYETFKASIHPDDLPDVQKAVDLALDPAGDGVYAAEYRVIHRTDGQTRWIAANGKTFFREHRPVRLVGTMQDITERKHAQARSAHEIAALTRLQKLGALYVREGDPELVLSEIVDAAIAITDADFGNFQLVDDESGDLRIVAQRGFPQWSIDFWNSARRDRGACDIALERGARVIVADVEQDPIFDGTPSRGVLAEVGVRAAQSTPLVSRSGKPLGVLSTHYRTPRLPDGPALQMLDLLARQAADIIDRAQAEETLRRQAHMLRLSFDAIIVSRLGGAIESWNRGAEELYGFSETEALGRVTHALLQTVFPAPRAEIEAQLRDVGRWEGELRHRARDGREVVVSARLQRIVNSDGVARVLETNRDVTHGKRAEDALRASEEKYRNLFVNMAEEVHFWRVVRDGAGNIRTWRLVDANPPALKTWGRRSVDEVRGKTTDEIFGPGASEHYLPVVQKLFATGEPYSFEDYFQNLDKYFRFTSVPLGEFFITTGADITAIKKAEAAARESERYFRLVTESLPQLVWTCAADGLCDYLSPQWVRYTGKSEAEQLGSGWLEQVHPDDRARVAEHWRDTSARGEGFETEYRIRRDDGAYRWFRALAVPLKDEAGRVVQWFGSNTDIDDIKTGEQALREVDRRKDEFLAVLGHELRNPIGSISNCVQTLESGVEGANAEDLRAIMARQVDHLVRLVDDLLEVARINQGRIELKTQRVDLAQVVDDAIAASRPLIDGFHHRLTVSLPSAPLPLEADPTRLAQVLMNLINNAAKFTTPGGCIDISAKGQGGEAVVSVRDNGVGIPACEMPRIFDLFAQFDRGVEQSEEGLGIGLALARDLVELHGGRIEARSEGVGRGSEFIVCLPLASAAAEAPVEMAIESGTKAAERRVLVVDDNRDVADSFVMLLETLGVDVRVAYGGRAALEIAAAFKPEMVFLDLSMPEMDGYETARRLRQLPDGRGVQLFALTGWGQEKARRLTREAGFDKHLTKPVEFPVLEGILAESR